MIFKVKHNLKSNKLLVKSSQAMASITTEGQLKESLDAWEKSFAISFLGDKEKVGQLTQNLYHLLN